MQISAEGQAQAQEQPSKVAETGKVKEYTLQPMRRSARQRQSTQLRRATVPTSSEGSLRSGPGLETQVGAPY